MKRKSIHFLVQITYSVKLLSISLYVANTHTPILSTIKFRHLFMPQMGFEPETLCTNLNSTDKVDTPKIYLLVVLVNLSHVYY